MKAALAEVKLVSFGMDLAKAEHHELPSGEPYVLIPTETVMDAARRQVRWRDRTRSLCWTTAPGICCASAKPSK